jgi:hypothetical protein
MSDHQEDSETGRVTSPMQSFETRQAGVGLLVLLIGVGIAYLLPTLL